MGCSFLPYAGGNFFAGQISGGVYQNLSDKITLLQRAVEEKGFDLPAFEGSGLTQNEYISKAGDLFGMNSLELTDYLWVTYNPMKIWYVVFGIGIATVLLLWLYDKILLKSK